MNLADLLRMEETKNRQMNPEVLGLTSKQVLRVIRTRIENNAASDTPHLTLEENRPHSCKGSIISALPDVFFGIPGDIANRL